MQTRKTQNGTEYVVVPLTADEMDAIADEMGYVTVCVPVALDEVAETDYEGYLDMLDDLVCGYNATLMDICFSATDVDAETGEVIVKVTAAYEAIGR